MTARPWMPLYVGDYLRDTRRLGAAEHGAYLLLIMEYWQSDGLPDDDRQLARIACMTLREWKRVKPLIAVFFGPGWRHKRIDAEIAKANVKSALRAEAGKRGGKATAKGKQLLHQNTSKNQASGQASSSQSQPEKKVSPPSEARPSDADLTIAADMWNDTAGIVGWPKVQALTQYRKAALRQRLTECGGLEGWGGALAKAAAAPFLCGENDRSWKADFDFFTKARNFTKLMEGGYDRARNTPTGNGKLTPHDAILGEVARQFAPGSGADWQQPGADVGLRADPGGTSGGHEPAFDLAPGDYRREH